MSDGQKKGPSLLKQWSNAKAALKRKISMGGPLLRADYRRQLTPEEIASKQVGERQLTAQELKDQKILVSECWSEEKLAQLQQELQDMAEVDAMPVQERTATITQKLSVQMDSVQANTEQNAASLARIEARLGISSSGSRSTSDQNAVPSTAEV